LRRYVVYSAEAWLSVLGYMPTVKLGVDVGELKTRNEFAAASRCFLAIARLSCQNSFTTQSTVNLQKGGHLR